SRAEPGGTPPRRQDFDAKLGAWFAPCAPAGGRLDAKGVRTGRQRGVTSAPLVASHLVPLAIEWFQHVPVAVRCRVEIAQRRESNRKHVLIVGERDGIRVVDRLREW